MRIISAQGVQNVRDLFTVRLIRFQTWHGASKLLSPENVYINCHLSEMYFYAVGCWLLVFFQHYKKSRSTLYIAIKLTLPSCLQHYKKSLTASFDERSQLHCY